MKGSKPRSELGRAAVLLPALAIAAAGGVYLSARRKRARPGSAYFAGAPLLIAHRGGAGLAPENTMLAFERAVGWWKADILELDVQPTRDGEVVVFHDATLDRTTDGTGHIADHTLDQIRALDAGYWFSPDGGLTYPFRGAGAGISTLGEVLERFPTTRVNIEIKDARAQAAVWEAIREADAIDRVLIAAGSRRDRAALRDYPIPVSAGREEIRILVAQLQLGWAVYVPPVDAYQVPDHWEGRQVLSPEMVQATRRRNIPVHVWTVDEIGDMHRCLDWGVDGIVTDRPDRLATVLNERVGRPLPPGPPEPPPEAFLERLLRD